MREHILSLTIALSIKVFGYACGEAVSPEKPCKCPDGYESKFREQYHLSFTFLHRGHPKSPCLAEYE